MDEGARAQDPPGLDLAALRSYLDRAAPGLLDGPLSAEVIAGGRSNLTYTVSDGRTTVVVRRPPLGHVLATAHDMSREHRVMTALATTDVPVPQTYSLCEDPDVIGAPFYVMQRAPGRPYRLAAELEPLGVDRTRAISTRLVDVLGALHQVDPAQVGLEDFGHPQGFLARQVRRWGEQLDASRHRELKDADALRSALTQSNPPEQPPAIVHGDYRLDNVLVEAVGTSDEITAVLDWEMATLGDPLTDLALLTVYTRLAELMPGSSLVTDVSRAPGFLGVDEQVARYEQTSGRHAADLGFYEALAFFKLAVILEGIHLRHAQGKTVGEGFAHIGDAVEPLLAAGLSVISRART
ncbi:phosphotransferase family protein [Arsenicicoccus piscis]|uniref:Acyl-CoA dehydrogenase n=1 Tax=Arsenicicoccus piscis TaxID=673954 RepID=A0ABQ6HUM3_9MICO|nr:phosphotransferase family protein [Arsenicicoccus piscis]GMA21832.1 acyl-CoA dehydrogenase [Arsenicicoccus piscis]